MVERNLSSVIETIRDDSSPRMWPFDHLLRKTLEYGMQHRNRIRRARSQVMISALQTDSRNTNENQLPTVPLMNGQTA
jgi:hypothetical protein